MLENNSNRLMFAAIAIVVSGAIMGTMKAAYPNATNVILSKTADVLNISQIGESKLGTQSTDLTPAPENHLSIGGRNLYLNSRALTDGYGTNGNVKVTVEPFDSTTNMWHIVAAQGGGGNIGIYLWNYADGKTPDNSDWSYSADIKGTGKASYFGIEYSVNSPVKGDIGSSWSRISQTGHFNESQNKSIVMYFDTRDRPLDVYIKLPKLEAGNNTTVWTTAPED